MTEHEIDNGKKRVNLEVTYVSDAVMNYQNIRDYRSDGKLKRLIIHNKGGGLTSIPYSSIKHVVRETQQYGNSHYDGWNYAHG